MRLACGTRVLLDADTWYVPSRLTPAMNAPPDGGDTSFRTVVAPLGVTRDTFEAHILWQVLPPDWDMMLPTVDHPERSVGIPPFLFKHRALLTNAVRTPISDVDKRYIKDCLAFTPRR